MKYLTTWIKTFTNQNFLFSTFAIDGMGSIFQKRHMYVNKAILLIFDIF